MPSSGFYDPTIQSGDTFGIALSIAQHWILPAIACTIGSIAGLTRYYRFGMISTLQQPYILAARARGISQWRILSRHAFKNASLPIITLLGMELPGLVSGAYIVEYIFSWPGLGQLGINAAFSRDYPILMGTLVMSSILILIGNMAADVLYRWADPRIKQ
ncbi:ABC transporter permease [bacterium]|nr:ABC transporter permease [bacterium]